MPKLESPVFGAPCWIEIGSSDVERARAFYGEVFGWTSEDPNPEFGGYYNYSLNGVPIAGGMPTMPGQPNAWTTYLATRDIKSTFDEAKANGATAIVEPMEVMELGSMAVFIDPAGAAIGLWQPGEHKGFGLVAEPGAPSWFELATRDYGPALDFYRSTLGWEIQVASDTPEFRYSQGMIGGEPMVGVMDAASFLPDGVPSHWSVYLGVADTDAALAKVVELGGTIVTPAEDSPYGRLAQVTDPMGASFKIVAANEEMPAKS